MEPDARAEMALEQVLAWPAYSGVYTSPWWPVPGANPGGTMLRAWKKAVLRRREQGGADHLGHLFLVERDPGTTIRLEEEQLLGRPAPGATSPPISRVDVEGDDGRLMFIVRPRTDGSEPFLLELARALATALSA